MESRILCEGRCKSSLFEMGGFGGDTYVGEGGGLGLWKFILRFIAVTHF